jgi:23S rRNA (cytidine1920-2'-O)/16S rRNA (cytidine1409-2'-O)-methyltransferase
MPTRPTKSAKRIPLDQLLLERGYFQDRKTAQSWIMAGKVWVADQYLTKAGHKVRTDVEIRIKDVDRKYVSRGGLKLEAALSRFGLSVSSKTVLDAGASAGGFTDCLLQHGAAKVYAVDVGYGQIRGTLTNDPRVVNLERTNIGALKIEQFEPALELCVADLSYVSLTKALPTLGALFVGEKTLVCLIKPLFEGASQAAPNSMDSLRTALETVAVGSQACSLSLIDLIASPILGNTHTIEFLGLFSDGLEPRESFERLQELVLAEAEQQFGRDVDS